MKACIWVARSGRNSLGSISKGGEGDVDSEGTYIALLVIAPLGALEGYASGACETAKLRCDVQFICPC